MSNAITIDEVVTRQEAKKLCTYVKLHRKQSPKATVHNIVMKWLDSEKEVTDRFAKHGILTAYGAYLLEFTLNLT